VATWETVCALAAELPEVEEGTSYGRPALKVRGKRFVNLSPGEEGALVLRVDPDERPLLVEARPDVFFVTPHYEGWPLVLARLDAIDDDELRGRIEDSWAVVAPRRLVEAYAARRATSDG
jgi:hypothetical protein